MARGGRHQGAFGSLDNGTARPVLSPDALIRSRNTEHLRGGSIKPRPGRVTAAEVASQLPPFCAPMLIRQTTDDSGTLVGGETYYLRATYVTAAGETDDLHSSDADNPGPATLEWVQDIGRTSVQIAVPIHIRRRRVIDFGHDAGGQITFRLEQPDPDETGSVITVPNAVCDPDIYIGWLVYPLSPRLIDETNLGTNPDIAVHLYDRVKPWATVTFYDSITQTFTLDRRVDQMGETGFLDKDFVDLMMPDRAGLPILSTNVYISEDGVDFHLAGTAVDGFGLINVLGVDTTATLAPSTRVDRDAPALVAVDVTERVQGKPGDQPAMTRLEAGIYGVRTTRTTGDQTIMGDPAFAARQALLGWPPDMPPLRAEQETWPSRESFISILDDQGIQVTPVDGPEINSGWNLYARQLRPHRVLTFEDASIHTMFFEDGFWTQTGSPWDFAESLAGFYGSPQVPASSFSSNAALLDAPPQNSWGLARFYSEYLDDSVIINGPLDPFDPDTRGFPPGYPDIRETLDPSGDPYFSYASSRDDIPINRHLWWFHLDSVTDADDISLTTHAILRMQLRIRTGKTNTTTSSDGTWMFIAGDDKHVDVRAWDEDSQTWTVVRENMGLTRWFERMGFPVAWDEDALIVGEDNLGNPTTARYLVFALGATDCVGFDVCGVELELYRAGLPEEVDDIPSKDSVLQRGKFPPIVDDSYTLQNPLAYRVHCEDGVDPSVGEFESIRPDNTAQWPVVVSSLPIVGKAASSKETKVNFVGCADSCFRDTGGGALERVLQEEGRWWNQTLRHDWRFENDLARVFICNEGEPRWNYRFDGLATYPMGLPKPLSGVVPGDDEDGFGTSQGEDPSPTLYGDRCIAEELFAGRITSVNQTSVPEGQQLNGQTVIGFDLEYYVVYKRYDPATGRSYVVRSEPAQFTKTQRVRGTDDFPPTVAVEAWLSPEPQVTHIEIYRNRFATADYYLVSDLVVGPDGIIPDYSTAGIPINDEVVDPATARVYLQFEDRIEPDDSDLTLPIAFETGRPTAAVMMRFNRGRLFFVQQRERTVLAWTNITSTSGAEDPEGFYVKHQMIPPVRESSAITCLSIYNDMTVVSCNTGMVGVQGISDRDNSGAGLSAGQLATDGGWMGPDAYCDVDNIQYGMTRQGPAWLAGGELVFVGPPIEGTLLAMVTTTEGLYNSRCYHYRTAGRSQVWFSYSENPGTLHDRALVFDEGVNSESDRERFWKEWTEMPLHGLAASRDGGGVEYPLMGGTQGRLYRHDTVGTDAGLLIVRDLATRPFENPGNSPKSFMPWWAYFYTSGQPDDLIFLDIWPDFTEQALNVLPIPIQMGGDVGLLWGQAVGGDPDDVWGGEGPAPWVGDRIGLGGVIQQITYRLFLDWGTWPAGNARCISFESTGFNPFMGEFGPRDARANAGARR